MVCLLFHVNANCIIVHYKYTGPDPMQLNLVCYVGTVMDDISTTV